MKYKALFLDLDGTTVLPFAKRPTPRVIEAIHKAHSKIRVCLATGRLIHQCSDVIESLNLNGLCVVANGIQIYDPVTRNIIKEIGLNRDDVPKIVEVFRKHGVAIRTFNGENDVPYRESSNAKILSIFNASVPEAVVTRISNDLEKLPTVVVHKLLSPQKGHWGLEICAVLATKQHGIYEAAKILKLETHEIIGIGDGYNDFPLLMACGLKIAMGNAVKELKSIADFVAPSVDEDGVATVIEKYILT